MAGRLYERAKNWRDTQSDIAKLFTKYNIGETQWSVSDTQKKAALSFIKDFARKSRYDADLGRMIETEPAKRVVVQLNIPIGAEGPDRNSAFRILFWYLKSKLEALAFSFQDGTEFLSWEREFFGNTMIQDIHGNPATAFDAFRAGEVALAPPRSVIALTTSK